MTRGERGHIGVALATLLGVTAAAVLVAGIAADSDAVMIIGAILAGLGIVVTANAPHIWVRRVYRRLDRVSPEDPDARPDESLRIEF